jgi:hypothetical protein
MAPLSAKWCSIAASVLACTGAAAQQTQTLASSTSDVGFSYFLGLGGQTVRYQETSSLLPVKSSATASSPLIITGALYAVNPDMLFSMDSETTFAAGNATEKWHATSAVFNGVTLNDRTLQTNGFSLSQTNTQLLGHYRVDQHWFAIGGPSLRTQTFKRYAFVQGADKAVDLPSSKTVEESSSEVVLNLGLALESERVRGQASHYGARVTLGLPIWRRVENTDSPGLQFNSAKGYDLALEGRYSWALHNGIHAGLWGKWMLTQRDRAVIGGTREVPKSQLDSLNYGLEVLWKL